MSEVYAIEGHLTLKDMMTAGLQAISGHFTRLDRQLLTTQGHINNISTAFKALGAVIAGGAIFKGLEVVTQHGMKLEHFKTQLEAAGYTTQQVTAAMNAAWKEAGSNLNTVVSDNVKNIHHLANVTGSMDEAMRLLPLFNRAEVAINSMKDDEVKGRALASERQTYDYARFLEELGVTSQRKGESHEDAEHRTTSYVNSTMKGIIAMRGLVDPSQLYQTVQNSGGTQLKWNQDFVSHELFPLIQALGPAAGNIGYMLNATLAQGRTTTATADALEKYGFIKKEDHGKDADGRTIKGVRPGAVIGSDLLQGNWVQWFKDVYIPTLAKAGITTQEGIEAANDEIFRNKSVLRGANYATNPGTMALLEKERQNIDRVPDDAIGILQAKDPSSVMNRFHRQWENLLEGLGQPNVENAMSVLDRVTNVFSGLNQLAAANPAAVSMIGSALAVLATGLLALGGVLIGGLVASAFAAIGTGGFIIVGLVAFAAAITVFWDKIKGAATGFGDWWNGKGEYMDDKGGYHAREKGAWDKVKDMFNFRVTPEMLGNMGKRIGDAISGAFKNIDFAGISHAIYGFVNRVGEAIKNAFLNFITGNITDGAAGARGSNPLGNKIPPGGFGLYKQNQSYVPDGGNTINATIPIKVTLDAKVVGQSVVQQMIRASSFQQSAANFDGVAAPASGDFSYT